MCEEFAEVDISGLAAWITAIDFSEWPQQRPIDDQLKPAMVSDRYWHGFYEIATPIVSGLMQHFPNKHDANWLLSVIMPKHDIEAHRDLQASYWHCRVHVPIVSNEKALWIEGRRYYWMKPGLAYKVDTTREHAVVNAGATPRVHFMFDVT